MAAGSPGTVNPPDCARRWRMGGRVQGVGYRAFVFNLAQRLGLRGNVQNLTADVQVEAQGAPATLDAFARALVAEAPPLARPVVLSCEPLAPTLPSGFRILASMAAAGDGPHLPPDLYLCADCRRELLDPHDRRYRYPFINCTQCGPRYTLITRMPYDRPHTTMAGFPLCPACAAEYADPRNRRFHAQPLACPQCGPQLTCGAAQGEAALATALAALRAGQIVAVKGIGGYHLMCDAHNEMAIAHLRNRKPRPHKPLAVMFPWRGTDGLDSVRAALQVDEVAAAALIAAARPIVLLPRRPQSSLPPALAPGLHEIGAMLPYSPLHHLLLEDFGGPLVATSGNVSGEPVLTDNAEAEARLGHLTDCFLHHDRPIARPADDSVLRVIAGQPRLLRNGRGLAPLEFELPFPLPQPLLAVGGHMKNAVALGWGRRAVLSPHIGDLDSPRGLDVFEQVALDLQQLYGVQAAALACDTHPGYASSRWAQRQGLPLHAVLHHHAHAAALTLEHEPQLTWLMCTWDGVGLGADGTLWGGETLHGRPGAWQRLASFKPFHLPGGERAARQPWRSAAALCWQAGLPWTSPVHDDALLHAAWQQDVNAPATSAVGRLFDAAASLLGLCQEASFEGQAPMWLEAAAQGEAEAVALPLQATADGLLCADWTPLLHALRNEEAPSAQRAMQFHVSLAQHIVQQAQALHPRHPFDAIGLTGGVFQNKLLAELAVQQLTAAGFRVHLPQQAPCNDGGLALGQLIEAAHTWKT